MGGFRRSGAQSSQGVSFRRNRLVALASILAVVAGFGQLARPTTVRAAIGDIATFAGLAGNFGYGGDGGPATAALLNSPNSFAVDSAGNVYIADSNNARVRKVDPSGVITTFAGNGLQGYSGDGGPATSAELNNPDWVAFDSAGDLLIAEAYNDDIRKVDPSGIITTIAGTPGIAGFAGDGGTAIAAQLNFPFGLTTLPGGGFVFSDLSNNRVRKVDASGTISTIAGNGTAGYRGDGGLGTAAELNAPIGTTIDGAGDLYIVDDGNNVVRRVDASGTITTVAGNGTAGYSGDGGPATAAQFNAPYDVKYGEGLVFVSDYSNNVIRKIDAGGTISTVVGNGTAGYSGDGGPALLAQLNGPTGMAFTSGADLLIADNSNDVVRDAATVLPDLLRLTASAPAAVSHGQSFAYTFALVNPGNVGPATGVTLSDPLPTGVSLVSATPTQGTCSAVGGVVNCALGTLSSGATATVTVTVAAPSVPAVLVNTATVTANEVDPAPGDNAARATTYVDPADLSVTGTASPDPVVAGQVQAFTMSVQNVGPTAATGVQLSNPLPSGVTFQSASPSQGSCALSGRTVTCSLGALGVGGSATVTFALVPSLNVVGITDTAIVSGNQVDQNSANNTATVQTTVVLGFATQFTNPQNTPLFPGQEVTNPAGITGGADGNVWFERLFPNFGEYQSEIGRVTTNGVYQPAFTADQSFIEGMVVGPDGNVWFAETGFSGDPSGASIGRITPQGKVTLLPEPCGSGNCSGRYLTVGPDGNIWFPTASSVGFGIGRIDIKTGAMAFFPTPGNQALYLTAGSDGNLWYNTTQSNSLGRMTPSGVNTVFTIPNTCGGSLATGQDRLLWVVDVCGHITALNVGGAQPKIVTQFLTGNQNGFGEVTRGPDAVYFTVRGSRGISIGRATTAGLLYYSTGAAGFIQHITAGPDGNIWFTDFDSSNNPSIGHVSPPPGGTTGAPVIGRLNPSSAHSSKTPAPNLATGSDIRHPKPPPIAGDHCADVINPAQGTVINGDVTVDDNGFGCILSQVTVNGDVHVTAGAFADLSFSTVNGSVIVDSGGQAHVVGSHVTGSVTGNGSSFVTMFNSKVDVDVTSNPSQYGLAMVCGTTVGGNVTDSGATDTTFPSVIGDPTGPIPCARNLITGNLILSGNSEQILVHGNNVGGSIVVTNNSSTAAFDIRNNFASSLSCSGNAVTPTGGGNHGTKSGQCAGL